MSQASTFGQAIRVGRLIRGETYQSLSQATGIPSDRLRAFETGLCLVRPEELTRIWRYLRGASAGHR
jgi:hypothetical protein